MENSFSISGNIVDVKAGKIFPGTIKVVSGKISSITPEPTSSRIFILPGLIDAHVHIESSMLVPSEFARLAVIHGTTATVSDPHEIGNVLGIDGVKYMIINGKTVPFHFYFGAPSCVPATSFETSGAIIGPEGIRSLLNMKEILYLSEMMNYPGVIHQDPMVMEKISIARQLGKVIDGHAPGLKGSDLDKYLIAGISTDHETISYDEGKEKLQKGMKIIIREGSAAKNFEALIPLLGEFPDDVMFCSDDKHPDDLVKGHINKMLARAVAKGFDPIIAIRAATLNPVLHYSLDTGLLQKGDSADLIVVDDLKNFNVLQTYVKGQKVAENGQALFKTTRASVINHFHRSPIKAEQLKIKSHGDTLRVIQVIDGELVTDEADLPANIQKGEYFSDPDRDILKIVVVNRYENVPPAIGFVRGFGIKKGALASTVAHDSHNIIAVGADEESLRIVINALIDARGGITVASDGSFSILPLPIAGLMSNQDGRLVARQYEEMNAKVKALGGKLTAPFMTLSFLALLVIPKLKLSDKGLFDGNAFKFVPLEVFESASTGHQK